MLTVALSSNEWTERSFLHIYNIKVRIFRIYSDFNILVNWFISIRTVRNSRRIGGFAGRGRSRKKNVVVRRVRLRHYWPFRGGVERLDNVLRIDRYRPQPGCTYILTPRDRPLNNADHRECCACLSPPTEGGIRLGFCHSSREPARELANLVTLQGEIAYLIAVDFIAKTRLIP